MYRFAAAIALLSSGAIAQPATDKAVFGYYLGIPVFMNAQTPPVLGGHGPAKPSNAVPDLIVYVTAPTSKDETFHAPQRWIPTPQGRKYLPPHEDTLTRFVTESAPADALGYFVIAGPKASPDRVQVSADPRVSDPASYLPGGPLARAIKVGEQWLPLNNHVVIEYGLRTGLLATRYFDYGGLMWAGWMDEGAEALQAVTTPAPPVDAQPQQ